MMKTHVQHVTTTEDERKFEQQLDAAIQAIEQGEGTVTSIQYQMSRNPSSTRYAALIVYYRPEPQENGA